MNMDCYGNVLLDADNAREVMLRGRDIDGTFFQDPDQAELFNRHSRRLMEGRTMVYPAPPEDMEPDQYHKELSGVWNMPDKYQQLDIAELLLPRATHPGGPERLAQELELFHNRGMIPVLRAMAYLVDTMREHQVVWGVGRGSSVASYTLHLLGINRINPLEFDLDIEEFLRREVST